MCSSSGFRFCSLRRRHSGHLWHNSISCLLPPCAQPYLSTPVSTGSIKNRMKRRAQHFQLLYGDISSPQGQMVIPKYLSTSWLGHSRQISRSGLHSAYSAAQPQWEIQDLYYFILLHVTLLKFGVVAAARSTSRRVDAKLISSPLAAPPPSLTSQASLTLLVQNPPPVGNESLHLRAAREISTHFCVCTVLYVLSYERTVMNEQTSPICFIPRTPRSSTPNTF
jgi:hypothetical protein